MTVRESREERDAGKRYPTFETWDRNAIVQEVGTFPAYNHVVGES